MARSRRPDLGLSPKMSIKERIASWVGGMSWDVRNPDLSSFFLSINNDIFSHPKRVTPFRSTEDNTTDGSNTVIIRFLFANSKLYGLGQASSVSTVTKLYTKASDQIGDAWTAAANGADGAGANNGGCFINYKGGASTTYLYGGAAGTRLWAYDVAGGVGAFNATAVSITYTRLRQAIVTSDDLLLVPYDNKIAVKDGGTSYNDNWETARLTLPADLYISDLEEIGTLVAITCRPVNSLERRSIVYLWDKVSPDVSEAIEIGEGDGQAAFNIDGELYILTTKNNTNFLNSSITLRRYIGNKSSKEVQRVDTESYITDTTWGIGSTKVKDNNTYTFVLGSVLDGTTRINTWQVGRVTPDGPVVLTMSRSLNNNTQPTGVQASYKVGSYYFYAINGDGTVKRTNNDNAYTATSTYITQKINGENRVEGASRFDKQLKWAGITCPPLPAGSTISLYYRVNATTSWTKIFDFTTADGLAYQQGITAAGADFLNFKELQFKIETTGGTALPAEFSSLDFEYDILDNTTEQ